MIFTGNLSPMLISQIIVNRYRKSPMIEAIRVADRYYEGHGDIERKKRVYFDKDRKPIDNPNANNARIKTNFLRMLVQQKQDYAFAKTFVLKISSDEEKEVDLLENNYGKEWKKFLDSKLFRLSYVLSGQAINHGVAWCYVWIDGDGELQVEDVPADLVFPVWKERQHLNIDRLVYNYVVENYNGSISPTVNEYAEYWSENERILFDVTNGYNEILQTLGDFGGVFRSHMTDGVNEIGWGKIPFVALKSTDDEKTLLSFIKEQIDSYDLLVSRSVDGLVDDLDPLLVFKGISPSVGDLLEAREIAKMTRTISLDTDGDAGYIQAQTAIDAHLKELEALRRDIIQFGYGVDYENERFGGNPNQLVIKSLYQNLDTYTDGLERQFQNFIDNLKYFFDKWYEFSGKGSFDECQRYKILIKLDRSMMMNQSALIDDSIKLAGVGISRKTQLEFNPVVQDVELEMERIEEEQKKSEENGLFNFMRMSDGGNEDEEKEEEENEQNQRVF